MHQGQSGWGRGGTAGWRLSSFPFAAREHLQAANGCRRPCHVTPCGPPSVESSGTKCFLLLWNQIWEKKKLLIIITRKIYILGVQLSSDLVEVSSDQADLNKLRGCLSLVGGAQWQKSRKSSSVMFRAEHKVSICHQQHADWQSFRFDPFLAA